MDQEKFKDWKKKVDNLLGLQALPADSLVRLILADAAPIHNGSEPEPGPSSAITSATSKSSAASNNIENQILNDETLALSLFHEEEEQAVTPEEMLRDMMHQAEMWVGDVFRHSIGNFYDKSTLDTKLDKVYERIIEFAEVKYLAKCDEKILGLYDTWWKNVYYPTVESMNVNKKNTKFMIEAMFKKRFGGLEKRLCQKWCITYTSIDDVMNVLMEDDPAEMGLLKSIGSELEWVGFYYDLKLIKATAVYQTISYLREYEEELISLVKNDKNGFMGKDYYVNKCTSKPRLFKVPPGLCNGTKQKVVDLANHLSARLDDIVKTEKAAVAAAAAYSLNQYETAMEQKLAVAKHVSEIDNLHKNLKNSISIAFKETGEDGFSYAWNFDRMPLSKTLEDRHRAFRDSLQARLAAAKQNSVSNQGAGVQQPSQDLRNGAAVDPAPAPDDSTAGVGSKGDVDEDQNDVKPEVKHEPMDSSSHQQNGHDYAHVDVKTEYKVKSEADFEVKDEAESPPPLVKDEHEESSSESPAKPNTPPRSLDSAISSPVITEGDKTKVMPPQTKQGQNEPSTSSVASQLSQQPVVKMSSLNPPSKLDSHSQKPPVKIYKIKRRGIGIFLSQFKILYLVEGSAHKELSPKFEIPSKEEGVESTTFDLHQLLSSQTDRIDKYLNIGRQDIQPYNEVPMAYHLSSIREMMKKQQGADQNFNDSVVAVAIPASITSFSRNRLKVAMELAGMNRTLLVQITTSIAVGYSQKPMLPTDHKIVVAYVCDGLIEMAVFRISQNKCIQLSAGINTTFPEVTEPHIEGFRSTFKELWCDLLSKAGIEKTSVHAAFAILEKPTASAETVQSYSEAIRNEISEKSRLFFTRDCRIILAGLKTVSNYGSSLPNGLIEEVYPWKFTVKHPDPEKIEPLSDFGDKAKTRSSHEKVKVCNKPVIVQRLWHGGGANEELQFTLKPLPPFKTSTFRLLTEISLHPEGILTAACIQKTEGICAPVFIRNHMPLEKDVEAAEQLKELRNVSSEPSSKKSKTMV